MTLWGSPMGGTPGVFIRWSFGEVCLRYREINSQSYGSHNELRDRPRFVRQ
jgi:hypothetical protein